MDALAVSMVFHSLSSNVVAYSEGSLHIAMFIGNHTSECNSGINIVPVTVMR